ncbi:hypothetical protein C2G38_2206257 [Gigaspora rosea]|uniref:Uncharacterized protein n=1 Tax=Gigaspora rosea TaxID=44941 RepID=A0A397ULN1_9GLOM|nr:hypothetical protein C2G38_2206257 [Gigaspora rosea]
MSSTSLKKLTACILEKNKTTEYALIGASVPKAVLVAMSLKYKESRNDLAQEPFLVIQKFKVEQLEQIDNYQKELFFNSNSNSNVSKAKVDSQIELDLMNSYKHKSKGQPKGTDRIQQADEQPKKAKQNYIVKFVKVLDDLFSKIKYIY